MERLTDIAQRKGLGLEAAARLRRLRLHGVLTLTICAFCASAHAEEVYQWLDENGIVNYGKLPPEGVDATLIRTNVAGGTRVIDDGAPARPARQPGADGPELSPDQQKMLDSLKRKEADRQDEIARIKAANCTRARDVLEKLTQPGRLRVTGANGETRVLPEAERAQRITEAQEGIAANCDTSGAV